MEQAVANDFSKTGISPKEKADFGITMKDWAIISIVSLALGLLLAWGGTVATASSAGPVAATVNGTPIYENEITQMIVELRQSQGVQDNEAWKNWLSTNSRTPETLRQLAIDNTASSMLLEQAAQEYNVNISDEEVESTYAKEAEMYGGDEQFESILASSSLTPKDYKKRIKLGLTSNALADIVLGESEVSDDQVLEFIKTSYPSMVDENTKDLSDLDPSLVEYVRSALVENARQMMWTEWFSDYKSKADIVINDMPQGLSYDTTSTGE